MFMCSMILSGQIRNFVVRQCNGHKLEGFSVIAKQYIHSYDLNANSLQYESRKAHQIHTKKVKLLYISNIWTITYPIHISDVRYIDIIKETVWVFNRKTTHGRGEGLCLCICFVFAFIQCATENSPSGSKSLAQVLSSTTVGILPNK